ncbi:MAG: protein kinase [Polyangiaceae bacterium]|nr:protein kinase [Polyangiaceae bacterium]
MHTHSKDRPPRLGRYQLVRQIGEGAAWTLWTAKDGVGPSARDVLVRWVRPSVAEDLQTRLTLAQSARALRELSHSGVARTIDLVEAARTLAVVHEPLEGATLEALLARAREAKVPMPVGVAVRIAIEALSALDALHVALGEGARPSDLCASSLLVSTSGNVKIIDFELDAIADSPARVARRAPERAGGAVVDARRADVYAVGVLLWECVTGRAAFADGAGALGRADSAGVREVDRCPAALADLIARALEGSAPARFESADDMGQDLFAATRGAVASPDDVAAFVESIDRPPEAIGDRQTARPPAPAAAPNPFERRASPSGRPPPMQGRPAGKVKLTVPMGKSTPPGPPQRGATLMLPLPAPPPPGQAPPAPPRGATLKMNVAPPPRAAAPTAPLASPTATAIPAASVVTPAASSSTPAISPAPVASPEGPPVTPAEPLSFAGPVAAPALVPPAQIAATAATPAPDPFYQPLEQSVAALPEVEPAHATAPAPLAALAPDPDISDLPLAPPARPGAARARLIAATVAGAATLLLLLAVVTRRGSTPPSEAPAPLSPSARAPSVRPAPDDRPVEPSVKREWGDPAAPPSGPDERATGPRGPSDAPPGGAAGAPPRASASEDKPPPPAPLRRKYNPKTI